MIGWRKRCLCGFSVFLISWSPVLAGDTAHHRQHIDPKADEIFRSMSNHLAAANRFSFVAYDMSDQVLSSGQKIQLANTREISVQRPNKVLADLKGDVDNQRVWYNGDWITVRRSSPYSIMLLNDWV